MAFLYEPGPFVGVFNEKRNKGPALLKWLTEPDNVLRMETGSELEHPAVEAIEWRVADAFPEQLRVSRALRPRNEVARMVGHMIRQIMEHRGFELEQEGVRLRAGFRGVFSTGARYRRKKK
ncbi:MAG: hypothetical protein HYS27_02405 [Deltaproteobacteria bacterium]|nr:hypothetical protein [Deltaproteobacteria bacterium]